VKLALASAAGNAFAIADTRLESLPSAPADLALELCARDALVPGRELDGLLVVGAPRSGGDCRMEIYNADGSRAEACGNGLRCVGRFVREHGPPERDRVAVETDCGTREVQLLRAEGGAIVAARAQMGVPRVLARELALETSHGPCSVTAIEIGNPHCVLFVADESRAPVRELGPELERHPFFAKRTNVEFVALRDGRLWVRVWERGVGETRACGTGACASAVAALLRRGIALPVEVVLPGGKLAIEWDGAGDVFASGPCEVLVSVEWPAAAQRKAARR